MNFNKGRVIHRRALRFELGEAQLRARLWITLPCCLERPLAAINDKKTGRHYSGLDLESIVTFFSYKQQSI